jgi:OTU domain-containing protein 6
MGRKRKESKSSLPPPPPVEEEGDRPKYIWEVSDDEEEESKLSASLQSTTLAPSTTAKSTTSSGPTETSATDNNSKQSRNQRRKAKEAAAAAEKRAEIMAAAEKQPKRDQIETQQLQDQVSKAGMRIVPVTPDGHCLYRSVAVQLYKDPSAYPRVRSMAAHEMRSYPDRYKAFCEVESDTQYEKYVSKVESSAEWGGHVELLALAQALMTKIQVYTGDSAKPLVMEPTSQTDASGSRSNDDALSVSYHRFAYSLGEHYNAVVPVDFEVPGSTENVEPESEFVVVGARDEGADGDEDGNEDGDGEVKLVFMDDDDEA